MTKINKIVTVCKTNTVPPAGIYVHGRPLYRPSPHCCSHNMTYPKFYGEDEWACKNMELCTLVAVILETVQIMY